MRIAIDGLNLANPQGTGVATYGRLLGETLHAMGHSVEGLFGIDVGSDPEFAEVLFVEQLQTPVAPRPSSKLLRWAQRHRSPAVPVTEVVRSGRVDDQAFAARLPTFNRIFTAPNLFHRAHRHFRRSGTFLQLRLDDPPDVMHWTYPVPIRIEKAHNIYTVHDLVPLKLPHTTLDDKQRYRDLIKGCVDTADRLCTVSECSREDIATFFPSIGDRVVNTYQTATVASYRHNDHRPIVEALGLRWDGYFLFFGAIEPKKNVGRLIEAYLRLGTATPLVLVSGRSWQSEAETVLLSQVSSRPALKERVIQLDYLPRSVLYDVIGGARAVVFPSLYEGFGLPVHEAMLMGTPVLTSNAGALKEIAGDAAVMVDPYDVDDIKRGLARLDTDADLRRELAVRGPQHAARFSAAAYQQALRTLYAGLEAPRAR